MEMVDECCPKAVLAMAGASSARFSRLRPCGCAGGGRGRYVLGHGKHWSCFYRGHAVKSGNSMLLNLWYETYVWKVMCVNINIIIGRQEIMPVTGKSHFTSFYEHMLRTTQLPC